MTLEKYIESFVNSIDVVNQGDEELFSKKGEKIICYTFGGSHYANTCPGSKKSTKGTTNVTDCDDGALAETSDWGNDEGPTGVMFCTKGITKSYKAYS
eukprot:15065318-Ditylum_brightwellii.AAC.2